MEAQNSAAELRTMQCEKPPVELTILMPCLNEAETVGVCVQKALGYLARSGLDGEVLLADNGSTDGSAAIARGLGARVVNIVDTGYGAALKGGIAAARGRFIIMGDADGSYDFSQLDNFVARLREGYDLVVGNRFRGGIEAGAMPALHRWLGNPVLSFIGGVFFKTKIRDFHCGLRGFNTDAVRRLDLKAPGMEFASAMIVRGVHAGLRITEVPTTLRKDGRSRRSHLRTWRDGWRHLRFLLMFSPRWLFLYPGIALLALGLLVSIVLLPGPVYVTPHIGLDVHTFIVSAFTTLIGVQCISFAIVVSKYTAACGLIPQSKAVDRVLSPLTLERTLLAACAIGLLGLGGLVWCILQWASEGFGPLQYGSLVKVLTISITAVALSLQLAFTAFLSAIIEVKL